MKKTILFAAAICTAATVFAQTPSSYASERVLQRAQQLAEAGARESKKAYEKDGLYAVAKLSSDCQFAAKSGKASPHQCMGIEAVGMALRNKAPLNSNTKMAIDWFADNELKNRIYAHCFMFLGVRSETECSKTFAMDKMATDSVVATITAPFKGDMTGDPVSESPDQTAKRKAELDRKQAEKAEGERKGAVAIVVSAYQERSLEGVMDAIQNCDMRAQDEDKAMCNYMDSVAMNIIERRRHSLKPTQATFFEWKSYESRFTSRVRQGASSDEHAALRSVQIMRPLTTDALRWIP